MTSPWHGAPESPEVLNAGALALITPLLERLKFIAILSSNLDEFFMVRVGGLQQKVHAGITVGSGADSSAPSSLRAVGRPPPEARR